MEDDTAGCARRGRVLATARLALPEGRFTGRDWLALAAGNCMAAIAVAGAAVVDTAGVEAVAVVAVVAGASTAAGLAVAGVAVEAAGMLCVAGVGGATVVVL